MAVGIDLVLQLFTRVVCHGSVVLMHLAMSLFAMVIVIEGLDNDTALELGHGAVDYLVFHLFVLHSLSGLGRVSGVMGIGVLGLNIVCFLVVNRLVMRLFVLIIMELGIINSFVDGVLVVLNGLDVVLVIKLMVQLVVSVMINMASNVVMDFFTMVGNGLLVVRSRLVNWLVSNGILIVWGLMNGLVVNWGLGDGLLLDWGLINGLVIRLFVLILMELGIINSFVDGVLVVLNGLDVVLVIEVMVQLVVRLVFSMVHSLMVRLLIVLLFVVNRVISHVIVGVVMEWFLPEVLIVVFVANVIVLFRHLV